MATELPQGPAGGAARAQIQDRGTSCTDATVPQRVIHATGIGAGAAADGLVAGLIATGVARTDQHGMGLAVTAALQVIRSDGGVAEGLWALGPIVRGVFRECTAVPDIRVQAQTLARAVAEQLAVSG